MATAEEIKEYISQPGVTDAQIAAAMQQQGLSPADVAAATGASLGDVQSRYEAAQQANQNYADLVTQAYGDIGRTGFGTTVSTIDQPGYDYWMGQLRSGAVNPEDFRTQFSGALSSAAQQNPQSEYASYVTDYLVDKAYQDIFGRGADVAGEQYWKDQLLTGKISPLEFEKAVAQAAVPASTSLADRLAVQKYLGEDVYAPEEFLTRTGGMGYQEVVDYISQNISDPTKIYQAAQQYNVNPNDIVAAMQAKGGGQLYTLSDVNNFFQQGKEGFDERFDEIINDTFGNDEERARIEQILGMKAGDLERTFDPTQFSRSSIERIEETLQGSRINKIQDALITKAIAKDVLKYTDDEMSTVVSDLVQGKEDDPVLKEIFNSLKSGNRMTKDEFDDLMIEAARDNPDAEVFKKDPDLKIRYAPIEPTSGVSGQYGYYNNAPIVNMSALDRYLKDSNTSKIDIGRDNDFGWATNSKYLGEVRNGAAVFGVKASPKDILDFDQVEKKISNLGGLKTRVDPESGQTTQGVEMTYIDEETGRPTTSFVQLHQIFPGYDPESGRDITKEYQDTRSQLESAAQKLNIDPRTYGSTKELFDAVQDKSKDLYLVIGRGTEWDPTVAKNVGLTVTDGSRGGVNHAAVLYQRVGDKGIALQNPQTFGFDDPKKKSFWQELASIPFIAEASLLIPGVGPGTYAAIKGVQSAILGADPGDILKNIALSYVGSSVLPQIAPEITASIGNTLLESGISPEIAGTLADAGARVALNTGMSVLAGADIGEAAERSLVSYGISRGISGGLSLTDFPKEFQPDVARLLTEAVLTGDPAKAAQNAIMRYGSAALKNAVKSTTNLPTTGATLTAARGGLVQAQRFVKSPRRVTAIRRDVRKLIPLRRSGLSYA